MKAQTLALCIPSEECDSRCSYCVSKMTWTPKIDEHRWISNLEKVRHFAELAQVTDVIITGKGEPTLYMEALLTAVDVFEEWPVILQTNGKRLNKSPELVRHLYEAGVDIIAVSLDHYQQMKKFFPLWTEILKVGVTPRATVILTRFAIAKGVAWWVERAKSYAIRQMSFRQMTIPADHKDTAESKEAVKFINDFEYEMCEESTDWLTDFEKRMKLARKIRRLPYGSVIKDLDGVGVTYFDYCVQDESGDDDIRSLILNQDGHLYTAWNSPASLIF